MRSDYTQEDSPLVLVARGVSKQNDNRKS